MNHNENQPNFDFFMTTLSMKTEFHPELEDYLQHVLKDIEQISNERKELLNEFTEYIRAKKEAGEEIKLNFICTHNSRRSHMGQLWAQVAANYYEIDNVFTFSGGTEATAFNPNAIAAMERSGFRVIKGIGDQNPRYEVSYGKKSPKMVLFSKKYDDPVNPSTDFAAIMTCSEADDECPIVRGAEKRIPLHYEDPKAFDGTPLEAVKYDERCRQIATEMFYVMSGV